MAWLLAEAARSGGSDFLRVAGCVRCMGVGNGTVCRPVEGRIHGSPVDMTVARGPKRLMVRAVG